MKRALHQAQRAFDRREVPVGAVIVKDGKVISRGFNRKEYGKVSLWHAEISAIEKACKKLDRWRLNDCTIYVTLEPCIMCTGAILESRMGRLVYGADNIRLGYIRFLQEHHPEQLRFLEITSGMMADESSKILRDFFKAERWLSSVESARLEIE